MRRNRHRIPAIAAGPVIAVWVAALVAFLVIGRTPPSQFLMPDVTWMFWTDAEPRLRAIGWIGVMDKGPDVPGSPALRNRVVYQSPSPGSEVKVDAKITLNFGQ